MYGYVVDSGYMGLVDDEFMLFATEEEYKEYLEDKFIRRDIIIWWCPLFISMIDLVIYKRLWVTT